MKKGKINNKITWRSVLAEVKDIDDAPLNYKIKTEVGRERLQASLASFGIAGTAVCNWKTKDMNIKKLVLVDGHSRKIEAIEDGVKKIWVSVPSRMLTPKEFTEMLAMFDYSVAGKVDTERIQKDLGTSADFYKKYGMEMPMDLLENLGSKASLKGLEYPEEHTKGKKNVEEDVKDIRMVNIFFTIKQEETFRKWEVELKKKLKVKTTTDVIYKTIEAYIKQNKIK